MPENTVLIIGTCDTKLEELRFLKDRVQQGGSVKAILLDVGRENVEHKDIDISQARLIDDYGEGKSTSDLPRGDVIKLMAGCAARAVEALFEEGKISGIISAGGSGGTSLASQVMREALPIGFPKMIVSTVASGDTGPIVGETDITMMYSVVDVAGTNQVLRDILGNAAAATAGMSAAYATRTMHPERSDGSRSAKRVGITMFGVTTPGADAIRHRLEAKHGAEVFVFHATGHGGKAMERLVKEGKLDAVLDLTTTEICDLHTGGVMAADQERLDAALEAGIPCIISVGATDMSNFGPKDTVPEAFKERRLYEHNPTVTLMRSSKEESNRVGSFIVKKLRKAKNDAPVQVWLPLGGVSMISTPGGPFADQEADEVLFETIREGLEGSGIKLVEDKRDINDEGFATEIADALASLW